MKGKNVATKRHRKRQNNIIEVCIFELLYVWRLVPWLALCLACL